MHIVPDFKFYRHLELKKTSPYLLSWFLSQKERLVTDFSWIIPQKFSMPVGINLLAKSTVYSNFFERIYVHTHTGRVSPTALVQFVLRYLFA